MTADRDANPTTPITGSPAAGQGPVAPRAVRGRRRPLRAMAAFSGILFMSGLVLAACGEDTSTETATGGTDQGVEVSGAWARTSPAMASAGAAYMDLTSAGGDRLVAAAVDTGIAATTEVHETVAMGTSDSSDGEASDGDMDHGAMEDGAMEDGAMEDGAMEDGAMEDGAMGHDGMDQAMTMRELASGLELPAGETVNLAPGGYHIMLLDLAEPLEAGTTFDLVLTFEQAGEQTVTVEVRDEAP